MNKENSDNIKKIIKYLIIGFIVGLSARYIPSTILPNNEIMCIGATASIIYSILDMYSPSIVIKN